MSLEAGIRLSDYLRHENGEHVRGVLHYDDDGYDLEYAREEIFLSYTTDELESWVNQLRKANEDCQEFQAHLDYGQLKASVQVFEDIVALHFPTDDGSGTVIALDSNAMEDLQDFIGSCQTMLVNEDASKTSEDQEVRQEPSSTGVLDSFSL